MGARERGTHGGGDLLPVAVTVAEARVVGKDGGVARFVQVGCARSVGLALRRLPPSAISTRSWHHVSTGVHSMLRVTIDKSGKSGLRPLIGHFYSVIRGCFKSDNPRLGALQGEGGR